MKLSKDRQRVTVKYKNGRTSVIYYIVDDYDPTATGRCCILDSYKTILLRNKSVTKLMKLFVKRIDKDCGISWDHLLVQAGSTSATIKAELLEGPTILLKTLMPAVVVSMLRDDSPSGWEVINGYVKRRTNSYINALKYMTIAHKRCAE